MKKTVTLIAMIVASCVGLMDSAFAEKEQSRTDSLFGGSIFESHFSKEFSISLGYKAWFTKWESFFADSIRWSPELPGLVTSNTSPTELVSIPVLSLRYNNFFVSGSYFKETAFSFPRFSYSMLITDYEITKDGEPFTLDYEMEHSVYDISKTRTEWDISVGYYLNQYIALTVGYKEIEKDTTVHQRVNFPDRIEGDTLFLATEEIDYTLTTKTSGPTIGIAGSVPLKSGWGLYGAFAYGFLESEFQSGKTVDSPYSVTEGGLSYSYIAKDKVKFLHAATITAGYRSQTFYAKDITPSGEDGTDTTQGFTLGLNLSF